MDLHCAQNRKQKLQTTRGQHHPILNVCGPNPAATHVGHHEPSLVFTEYIFTETLNVNAEIHPRTSMIVA